MLIRLIHVLLAGLVLMTGALPVRVEVAGEPTAALVSCELRGRRVEESRAPVVARVATAPVAVEAEAEPLETLPRAARVARFLLHRALLN
ncbi:MAG: hypothetical protein ACOZQL_23825 [Myxococcota bacterium]